MKKPLVRSRCGSVSRNSGRVGCAYCGHSSPSGSTSSPERVDDRLVLVGVQRADRVDDRAARLRARGRRLQQLELQLGQRLRRASAGRAGGRARRDPSTARRRARGRSRSPSSSRTSAFTTRTFGKPPASRERLRAAGMHLDRRHLAVRASSPSRRAPRTRRGCALLRCEPTTSAASCDARLIGRMRAMSTLLDDVGARARRSARRPARRRAPRAPGGSFCARISDERVLARRSRASRSPRSSRGRSASAGPPAATRRGPEARARAGA